MTKKSNDSEVSIETLKQVTKELNKVKVRIPDQIFAYRSHYAMPNLLDPYEQEEEFGTIIRAFATLHAQGLRFLLEGRYQRYMAYLMEEDFHTLEVPETKVYDKYFKIMKYSKIAHKMHKKDIIYVYDDDKILVIIATKLADKVRKIRGNSGK